VVETESVCNARIFSAWDWSFKVGIGRVGFNPKGEIAFATNENNAPRIAMAEPSFINDQNIFGRRWFFSMEGRSQIFNWQFNNRHKKFGV